MDELIDLRSRSRLIPLTSTLMLPRYRSGFARILGSSLQRRTKTKDPHALRGGLLFYVRVERLELPTFSV